NGERSRALIFDGESRRGRPPPAWRSSQICLRKGQEGAVAQPALVAFALRRGCNNMFRKNCPRGCGFALGVDGSAAGLDGSPRLLKCGDENADVVGAEDPRVLVEIPVDIAVHSTFPPPQAGARSMLVPQSFTRVQAGRMRAGHYRCCGRLPQATEVA